MVMAFSTDTDLQDLVPDILQLGIDSFTAEHTKAQNDILRDLRIEWWDKKGLSGELNSAYLTDSQFTRCASYLVLWKYALPQLTNWVDGDRFQSMITFYKSRYGEELESILRDGIEYDADNDSVVTEDEKKSIHSGRLSR
jgi:hypothetical protein